MPISAATRQRLAAQSIKPTVDLDDDTLCEMAKQGDGDAVDVLLTRYTAYARAKARTYFLIGADRDDIVQEGMIGLFKAIRDYDAEKTGAFRAFAELCITRQIITAIKSATRHKHQPLNSYVSLQRPVSDDDADRELSEFIASARTVDPVEAVVAEDEVSSIREYLAEILSELEVQVLNLYLEGRTYQEIAEGLERHAKSIDNALQRIKRKLQCFLDERQDVEDSQVGERMLRVIHGGESPRPESRLSEAVHAAARTGRRVAGQRFSRARA